MVSVPPLWWWWPIVVFPCTDCPCDPSAAVPLCGSVCCLTSAPASPPPHCPPEPRSNRSPLIVPDELLHFPANVRRGDLRRPGGVISTHSLGCCQRGSRQEPAWIAKSRPGSPRARIGASTPGQDTRTAHSSKRALTPACRSCCPSPRPLPFPG